MLERVDVPNVLLVPIQQQDRVAVDPVQLGPIQMLVRMDVPNAFVVPIQLEERASVLNVRVGPIQPMLVRVDVPIVVLVTMLHQDRIFVV